MDTLYGKNGKNSYDPGVVVLSRSYTDGNMTLRRFPADMALHEALDEIVLFLIGMGYTEDTVNQGIIELADELREKEDKGVARLLSLSVLLIVRLQIVVDGLRRFDIPSIQNSLILNVDNIGRF